MYAAAKDFRWASRARHTIAPAPTVSANLIRLGGGLGFPPELPDITAEAVAAAANRGEAMQYGPLYGLADLRDAIVRYLVDDGLTATRENILIVNGAKHGLELACRVFMEKGDTIIVTAPTYMTAVSVLKTHEVNFLTVSQDGEGLQVDELEAKLQTRRRRGEAPPKLLFDVPDFHNPTGITTSPARRRRLVELAIAYDFRIVEDDPYRRIRFDGAVVPPIKSFDPDGYVIGLGTVSKILAPGLRIGWANADPEIIHRMAAQKSDGGSNPFMQRIVAQLFDNGKVDHHIDNIKRILRRHRDIMVASLNRHLPGATVQTPNGGYFLWVELPPDVDAEHLAQRASSRGVEVYTGAACFAESPAPKNFLRLAYSFCIPQEIETGIKLLGQAYAEMVNAPHRGGADIPAR